MIRFERVRVSAIGAMYDHIPLAVEDAQRAASRGDRTSDR